MSDIATEKQPEKRLTLREEIEQLKEKYLEFTLLVKQNSEMMKILRNNIDDLKELINDYAGEKP